MHYNTEFSYIYNLLKLAAKDVPGFYPKWVREFPDLEQYESLSDIKKEIPVEDYREEVDPAFMEALKASDPSTSEMLGTKVNELINDLIYYLSQFSKKIENSKKKIKSNHQMMDAFKDLANQLKNTLSEEGEDGFAITKHICNQLFNGKTMSNSFNLPRDLVSLPFDAPSEKSISLINEKLEQYRNSSLQMQDREKLIKDLSRIALNPHLKANINFGKATLSFKQFIEKLQENISELSSYNEEDEHYTESLFDRIVDLATPDSNTSVVKSIKISSGANLNTTIKSIIEQYLELSGDVDSVSTRHLADINSLDSFKEVCDFHSFKILSVNRKLTDQKSEDSAPIGEIVFSKQPSDLLSMSIRADWTSCQNLLRHGDEITSTNYKAINAAISPYCAVIYLTNKEDFNKKGEYMLARSLVILLESNEGGEPILHIGKVYTNSTQGDKIRDLFVESLQKRSPINVDSGGLESLAYSGKYSFPAYEEAVYQHPKNPSKYRVPYLDYIERDNGPDTPKTKVEIPFRHERK